MLERVTREYDLLSFCIFNNGVYLSSYNVEDWLILSGCFVCENMLGDLFQGFIF